MNGDGGFLVEEFINAIAAQLDRVQDALRFKAVNRPLTYALKDLSLDLQVFVAMDEDGNVRFRASGPNESGASTVRLGFTTITRPMVEENTVAMTRLLGTGLAELGLDSAEQQRLEHLGVRNAAQLQQLGKAAGARSVARLAEVPEDRIRRALQLGRPSVSAVHPATPPSEPRPAAPATNSSPPRPFVERPVAVPGSPFAGHFVTPHQDVVVNPAVTAPAAPVRPRAAAPNGAVPSLRIAPETVRLHLQGNNLLASGPLSVTLDNQPLAIAEADDERIVVELPPHQRAGLLRIELPDGDDLRYELAVDGPAPDDAADPWAPGGRGG